MGLETATYPYDLNTANPAGTDAASTSDDHHRLVKTVLKNAIPGFVGVVMGTATESGSANAYALTLSPVPSDYAHLVGALLLFKATHANTGAATLNINSLGTKPIVDVNGGALASGDIANGSMVAVYYDGTSMCLVSANDRAPIDSPTFTGTPAAPTPSAADNSTKVATTAYVDTGLALKANLASPTFTGTPAAPTAAVGTNTTQLATTAFVVQQAFSAALPAQTTPALLFTNGSSASWAATLSGNSGKFLTNDGTSLSWSTLSAAPDVVVQYQTSSGVAGAAPSGARPLNTIVRNQNSLATLATSTVTLPAGTYYIEAWAAFSGPGTPGTTVVGMQIYNSTDSSQVGRGSVVVLSDAGSGAVTGGVSVATGTVTIAGSKGFQILNLGGTNGVVQGAALATGSAEVHGELRIWKTA